MSEGIWDTNILRHKLMTCVDRVQLSVFVQPFTADVLVNSELCLCHHGSDERDRRPSRSSLRFSPKLLFAITIVDIKPFSIVNSTSVTRSLHSNLFGFFFILSVILRIATLRPLRP